MGAPRGTMKYISTRDQAGTQHSFKDVVMRGLAEDRGLFVPANVEKLEPEVIKGWSELAYPDLALEVMSLFVDETDVPRSELQRIINKSYVGKHWSDEKVVPLVRLDAEKYPNISVLEQFHGPTCAFKDVALQFLGNLFEYFLSLEPGKKITVLAATSGDTGGAAIEGLRGKEGVQVFIMHPDGKVAKLQKLQMTTVLDKNVHNLAIDGDFDDCQTIVKDCNMDKEFKAKTSLSAVNSINWARILAQIVYYFTAYFQWCKLHNKQVMQDQVDFIVPSGNFGNALAGYYAKQLGLPIRKLIIATNHNDILHRLIGSKDFSQQKSRPSRAPAMDITVPSNFERYLFLLSGSDPKVLSGWMDNVANNKGLDLSAEQYSKLQQEFGSGRASDEEIDAMIKKIESDTGVTFCTHSAVAIHVAVELGFAKDNNVICLSTAHHGKFGDTVAESLKKKPAMPPQLADLETKIGKCMICPNDQAVVKKYVQEQLENVLEPTQAKCSVPSSTVLAIGTAAAVAIGAALFFKKR